MNKGEFVSFMADKHDCSKAEAERAVDMFTSSVIGAIGRKDAVELVGFGKFFVNPVDAYTGRNPRTGEPIKIAARNQPKFKVGQKLKDACN